ncbi:MAG: hypothetical protein ACYCSF_07150 [Acidimicrobiales bacterium]
MSDPTETDPRDQKGRPGEQSSPLASGPRDGRTEPGGSPPEKWRLWDHIGVISGVLLGLVAFGGLVVLATAGDAGALAIIVVVVIGIALIFFGGKLHGARRA